MGHTNKVWWQQEEGVMASLLLYLVCHQKGHLEMARDGLRFWLTYFVDRSNGGIFDTVSIDGWPNNLSASQDCGDIRDNKPQA